MKQYFCIAQSNVDNPRTSGDERKVTIMSLTGTPPASAVDVDNLGDSVIFGVGSVMLYPDGGEVWFYEHDNDWHKWEG